MTIERELIKQLREAVEILAKAIGKDICEINQRLDKLEGAPQSAQQDIPDLIAGAFGVSRGTAYDMMREALKEQIAIRACTWTPSGDPNEPGTWAASCGALWTFTDGGPAENDVHFCHKCGGALQIEGADDAGA